MWILFLLTAFLFVLLISEARHTNWSLFEAMLITLVLGHVVVVPLAFAIEAHLETEKLITILVLALTATAGMSFGAVWMLRDLKIIGEQRATTRLLYIFLGLLFVPSLLAVPYNLLLGWLVWIPVFRLERRAEARSLDALEIQRLRELETNFGAQAVATPTAPTRTGEAH